MADYSYDDDLAYQDDGPVAQVATLANWAGALISFALIVGLGVWGYQLLVRDVTGVPVVRALEGPMRIAPEDPGGLQAEYQGLTVTRVAVDGAAERPTERVVLAPAPLELDEEDLPVAELPQAPVSEPLPELGAVEARAVVPEPEPKSAIELAIAEALGAPTTEDSQPVGIAREFEIIPASVHGVSLSPRPPERPRTVSQVVENAVAIRSVPSLDIDPDSIPVGTRLVQLGAYPTAEEALEAWAELDARFDSYFEGKGRVVQEANAGGTDFYRLRVAGFDDLSDARRFCAVLVAENANCIPVVRR